MPTIPDLKAVGTELIGVGTKQKAIGKNLKASATRVAALAEMFNASGKLSSGLATLRSSVTTLRNYLGPVATALNFIANTLNGISIPTVSPRTSSINIPGIGNVTFVTGVNVGKTEPFTSVATRVNTVLTNVNSARDTLAEIAEAVKDFRGEFPAIKQELTGTANTINQGGTEMEAAGGSMITAGTLLSQQ